MVFQYKDEAVGREASALALKLLLSLLPEAIKPADAPPADWVFADERDSFIRYAQARALGPSTASLVQAAEARDIPWLRLNRYSLVQFGHGRYQQRIQATTTGKTGNIAVELASDKEETNEILRDLGLPVPKQLLVRSVREAVELCAADRLGHGTAAAGDPMPLTLIDSQEDKNDAHDLIDPITAGGMIRTAMRPQPGK